MTLTIQEQIQLSRRIVYFYHHVLVDIRCWLYEGKIDKALDAADCLEPIALGLFGNWRVENKETIKNEIHAMIDSFVKKNGMQYCYYEIFDLTYDEFVRKYLPTSEQYFHELVDFHNCLSPVCVCCSKNNGDEDEFAELNETLL